MSFPRISLAWAPWRLVLVVAVALRVRLSWWRSDPGAAYFPDSMCYWPIRPNGPCKSGHSYTVQYLWNFLTAHNMTEHRVLVAQLALGVVSCALVFLTLRLLTKPTSAMVLAMVFASIPQIVLMERAILTESVELALILLGTFCVVAALKYKSAWVTGLTLPIASIAFGFAVAVHAASILALGMSLVIAGVAIAIRNRWRLRDSLRHWLARLLLSVLLPVLFVAPSISVFNLHERVYGVSSYNPIANATLVYRWSPIIGCGVKPHATELTRAIVHSACHKKEFLPTPGMNLAPVFDPTTNELLTRYRTQLGSSSRELGSIATQAIMHHPAIVVREMSRSIVWQVVRERYFEQFEPAIAFAHLGPARDTTYPNWRTWFGRHDPTAHSPFPSSLLRVSDENVMLPNYLLWIAAIAIGVRLLLSAWTKRRSLYGWRIKPFRRFESAVFVALLVQLFGLSIAVAYSSAPDPRYWLPFIPTILLLIALGVLEISRDHQTSTPVSEIPDFK